jgi:hypothetical protein
MQKGDDEQKRKQRTEDRGTEEQAHCEYLMQICRAGMMRARMIEAEIASVGVALKNRMIDSETAVRRLREAQLLDFVGHIPASVGRMSKADNDDDGNDGSTGELGSVAGN